MQQGFRTYLKSHITIITIERIQSSWRSYCDICVPRVLQQATSLVSIECFKEDCVIKKTKTTTNKSVVVVLDTNCVFVHQKDSRGRRDQLGWSCCVTLVSFIVGSNTRIIEFISLYHKLPFYYGILQVGGTFEPPVLVFLIRVSHCNHIIFVKFIFLLNLVFALQLCQIYKMFYYMNIGHYI